MNTLDFESHSWIEIAKKASTIYKSYIDSTDAKELEKAKEWIDKALVLFETGEGTDDFPSSLKENDLNFQKKLFSLAGEIYANFDKKKSLKYFKRFQNYQFNKCIADILNDNDKKNKNFNDERDKGVFAYKFSSCSKYLFADLAKDRITLSKPCCMNDPFDSLYSLWGRSENLISLVKDKAHIKILHKSYDYYRFSSFCIDDHAKKNILRNILMWSHYADKHKGICIKYKLKEDCINTDCFDDAQPKLLLHRINYKNKNTVSVNEKSIGIGLAFTNKAKCWAYEKESRLICYDDRTEKKHVAISYKSDISIEAVYFGTNCSEDDKETIKKILDGKHVLYYDMRLNFEDVYKMDIVREK